jgi:hypothetical protein
MDYAQRGTELVIAELCKNLSERSAKIADIYQKRASEFGQSRHIEFATEITQLSAEITQLITARTAAVRINGGA